MFAKYSVGLEITRETPQCVQNNLFGNPYALRGYVGRSRDIDAQRRTEDVLTAHRNSNQRQGTREQISTIPASYRLNITRTK